MQAFFEDPSVWSFLTSRYPECQLLRTKINFCFDVSFPHFSLVVLRYDDVFPHVKPGRTQCRHSYVTSSLLHILYDLCAFGNRIEGCVSVEVSEIAKL